MKKIEALIPPFKLDEVKEALEKEKIHRMTVFEVKGAGSQQGKVKCYRGAHYLEDVSEVKVEVVTEDHEVDEVRDIIITALRTGDLCDGEVAVLPLEGLVRIRIGRCS
jgi:nitrogen regulatory protein P-II 1